MLQVLGSGFLGAFMGVWLGMFLGARYQSGLGIMLLCTAVGAAMGCLIPLALVRGAGRAGSVLYAPSGRSTPRRREYSLADSYAARGLYLEAIAEFEKAIAEDPADSVPYLRVARLRRDRMGDDEGAAQWMKRALADPTMPSGQRLLVLRELVELYQVRMKQPEKATPLLARIAEEAAGTQEGDWARATLVQIKTQMSGGVEEG